MIVSVSELGRQVDGAKDKLRRIEHIIDTSLAHVGVDDLQRELLDRVRKLLDADSAVILMRDTSAGVLVPTAASGLDRDVRESARTPVGSGFAGSIAEKKRPIVLDRVDDTTVLNPLWQQRGVRSMLGVPMLAEGNVVGVLHVNYVTQRRFTADDIHLLQVAADRIGLATQAATSRVEHAAATALQRSLLPPRLPSVPDVELAARYVPGSAAGIGGDWYDGFTLPSGRLGLVIGDVVGHGLRAAVIMGRMRSAARAYALETEDPAVVLEKLDRKMSYFESHAMATVLYAIFDPATHHLDVSLAGHPPPVHASRTRPATVTDLPVDLPIGANLATRPRRTSGLTVAPGDAVCFYTDGLVERRGRSVDEGLDRLCDAVNAGTLADEVCVTVMGKLLAGEDPSDDVALVVLCRNSSTEPAAEA
ncbi:MAG: SpoIIE family protein phosphatase [Actinophytocola sp.]|nr:SpoIIE family protein phosphatase [Actinophytocola sp.]